MNIERTLAEHRRILDRLKLLDRPWFILGAAPDPTIPDGILATHARVDINNVGRTAQMLGLGRADLTFRSKAKSWEEHPNLDTECLIWMQSRRPWSVRWKLRGKPLRYVGHAHSLVKTERDAIVAHRSGVALEAIGDLGKVTNGIAAACYGLSLGVPEIVLAGISLSKVGHSYDEQGRRRRQIEEDRVVLAALQDEPRLATTEPDLAETTGIRLFRTS